ncbi:XRE family transcriptional regulator [Sediminimonas qiaohouensis]|uniref:XRE family transcriptional regulator n=1 Tax=Sediminimonas qiaohouensis TaxID=552061 RepID=UPI000A031806|nr:XRE family transcriptional regulator [Sediminimonas qiaohouensis]
MTMDTKALVAALKRKRESEGLSLRALSAQIGVSFSSLARIERGEGQPDNNSTIRILEWLGNDGRDAGLSFHSVALVHFRAAKNVQSNTVHCLLEAASHLKASLGANLGPAERREMAEERDQDSAPTFALSKPEMEDMAREFRGDLNVGPTEPLEALDVRISSVSVHVPGEVPGLDERCREHLVGIGSRDWSAMSVPLDLEEERWAVLRNDTHSLERQRVTYLEECWHILLGHRLTKIAKIADAYGRTFDSAEEHDAYYLAAACMLPEAMLRQAVREGRSAAEIGTAHGASPELVEYRIKRLGLWRTYKNKGLKLKK